MRRSAYITTLALAVALLAGCTSSPEAGETTAPSGTPTAVATPSPTPTRTADTDDPSTWVISDEGVGPFVLGMPFAEALADARAIDSGLEDLCGTGNGPEWAELSYRGEKIQVTRSTQDSAAPLAVIEWYTTGPRTAEGIGVGSTVADVRSAYPDAVDGPYTDLVLAGDLFFYLSGSSVVGVGVSDGFPYEYCA